MKTIVLYVHAGVISYLYRQNFIYSYMAVKIEKWVAAQKKHRLSDKHVAMARVM